MKGRGQNITVLGGGSWGTALSVLLHDAGHRVTIWELFVERAAAMPDKVTKLRPGISDVTGKAS